MPRPARNADCHPERKHRAFGMCAQCYRESRKAHDAKLWEQWYTKNGERVRTKLREHRATAEGGARHRARSRAWALANPERAQEAQQRWREKNPERRREAHRAWRHANPERRRAHCTATKSKRRAAMRKGEAATGAQVADVRWSLFGRCYYCGECAGDDITVDHVVALVNGGSPAADNLVPSCVTCNSSKQNKSARDWLTTGRRATDPRFDPARRRLARAA